MKPEYRQLISDYMDGALTSRELDFVERLLKSDERARQYHDELRELDRLLNSATTIEMPKGALADFRKRLEADKRRTSMERFLRASRYFAVAAGLLLVVAVALVFMLSDKVTDDPSRGIAKDPPNPTSNSAIAQNPNNPNNPNDNDMPIPDPEDYVSKPEEVDIEKFDVEMLEYIELLKSDIDFEAVASLTTGDLDNLKDNSDIALLENIVDKALLDMTDR